MPRVAHRNAALTVTNIQCHQVKVSGIPVKPGRPLSIG